jgi:uncharacterized protein (UPF0276 family)
MCHSAPEIDVLEIPTEDYIVRRRRVISDPTGDLLREALQRFACVAHGIGMSIGSVEPFEREYMDRTRQFLAETGMDEFSEHLAFHRMDGTDIEIFQCMPFAEESLRWLSEKYWQARAWLGRPFGLENVSYSLAVKHCPLDEAEFLTELTRRTDCTLLLDVTNVFNNASNHGYDPAEFIRRLPGERIKQLHLAGGFFAGGMWHDSHDAPVMKDVWGLYEVALEHTAAEVVILERDGNFLPFAAVMRDVRQAREIFYRHRPASPPRAVPHAATATAPAQDITADPLAPHASDLRNYQRATIRRIADDEFRRQTAADSTVVDRDYPMSGPWQGRWRELNEHAQHFQIEKWKYHEARAIQEEENYRRFEWQRWQSQVEAPAREA